MGRVLIEFLARLLWTLDEQVDKQARNTT